MKGRESEGGKEVGKEERREERRRAVIMLKRPGGAIRESGDRSSVLSGTRIDTGR